MSYSSKQSELCHFFSNLLLLTLHKWVSNGYFNSAFLLVIWYEEFPLKIRGFKWAYLSVFWEASLLRAVLKQIGALGCFSKRGSRLYSSKRFSNITYDCHESFFIHSSQLINIKTLDWGPLLNWGPWAAALKALALIWHCLYFKLSKLISDTFRAWV